MASSSSSSSVLVTKEEFNLFHSIDRELYGILVLTLLRDPAESMQVMALWLWLEHNAIFRHVITTLLSLPHFLLNDLAEEAASFLSSAAAEVLPMTRAVLLEQPLRRPGAAAAAAVLALRRPTLAAELGVIVQRVCLRAMGEITALAAAAPSVPAEGRTMFVTFSKGYPVTEWEVREFFRRAYGDSCIESLQMQEVQPSEQSLFARIVFKMGSTIDVILNGHPKAKFTINGKHVWMRRFVPKKPKSSSHPNTLQPATPQQQQQPDSQPPQNDDDDDDDSNNDNDNYNDNDNDQREPLPELPASLFD